MRVNGSFKMYQTSVLRNAKRKRHKFTNAEKDHMKGDEKNRILGLWSKWLQTASHALSKLTRVRDRTIGHRHGPGTLCT